MFVDGKFQRNPFGTHPPDPWLYLVQAIGHRELVSCGLDENDDDLFADVEGARFIEGSECGGLMLEDLEGDIAADIAQHEAIKNATDIDWRPTHTLAEDLYA